MIFKQFYLGCLAQASYLIGDEQTRTAAIVDPRRDVDVYLEEADRHGLQIRHVLLTHFHADFVAGHLELRDRAGAAIHLGARAHAEYPFSPMKEGDAIDFGRVRLRVLETPGHTAESISILVYDLERDAVRPHAVTYAAVLHSTERQTLETILGRVLTPLSLEQVMASADAGAQLLDVRDPNEFAQSHLRGSINVGLAGQYATWAGTVLTRERAIVLIAEPGREQEAATRLGRIGFDEIAGYLAAGMHALPARPDLLART